MKRAPSAMARHRIITLLGLTSLVATMITITKYSNSFSQPSGRILISHEKLDEFKLKLKLIASEHNSNKTYINLLENIIQSQTKLQSKPDRVTSDSIPVPKDDIPPVLVAASSVSSVSAAALRASSSSQSAVPSDDSEVFVPNISDFVAKDNPLDSKEPTVDSKLAVTEKPLMNNKRITTSAQKRKELIINNILDVNQKPTKKASNVEKKQFNNSFTKSKEKERNVVKISAKPKLVFNSEDLITTERMKIDKPLGCDDNFGANLDLLVIVNSAVGHWEARSAIRDTWGKFAVERGAYLLFLIGSTEDADLQKRIMAEEERNSDLLQGRYVDNYYNLTLKSISLMKWISERCAQVKYVLKVDDDMFVNMQHITDFSETRNYNKCIIGKLAKNWKPHRNTDNKWYVPYEAFNGTVFPNFATGPAYMISGDAARPLYEWSVKLKPMYLEDVYITGIVAERAGIRRLNHGMFKNTHIKDIDECVYKKLMTSHKHSPDDIRRLWDVVYRQPAKVCDSPKTKKPNTGGENKPPLTKPVTPPKPRPVPAV